MTTLAKLTAAARAQVAEIGPDELAARRADPELVVIDVRDSAELAQTGRIPGAIHVPRGALEFALAPDSADRRADLIAARTLVFCCGSGGRSLLAAACAAGLGHDALSLAGGIRGWIASGGPVSGSADQAVPSAETKGGRP
jgi:rhodanese-related sulfurtransferase